MTRFFSVAGSVCVGALFAGSAALADVTAEQVWENWREQLSVYGQDGLTIGDQSSSRGELTISDLALSMSDGDTAIDALMSRLVFTENRDGTVTVTLPEEYPITITKVGQEDRYRIVLLLRMVGGEMTVSGDPEAMTYAMRADRYTLSVDEAIEAGEPMPLVVQINANNLSGNQAVTENGDLRDIAFDFTSDSVDILLDVQDGSDHIELSSLVTGLGLAGNATMPIDYDANNPEDIYSKGFAVDFRYTADSSGAIAAVTDYSGTTNITSSASDGLFAIAVDKDSLAVEAKTTGLAITLAGGQVPLPVDFSIGEYGFSLDMPMAKTDEPVGFSAGFNLTDLAINDMIWSMFDPAGLLPHDPATIQIGLTGTARLLFDLLDPAQTAMIARADAPGELHSLSLDNLRVSVAGAELTGGGSFDFDNADLQTFDGIPRPTGQVSLDVIGLNKLLDTIVAMGFVPEDEIMGARMMMGMFADVVGDDHLTSKFEVTEDGQVLANGQRIR